MEKATDVELYRASEYLQKSGYLVTRSILGNGQWRVLAPDNSRSTHPNMESAISAAAAHHDATKLNPKTVGVNVKDYPDKEEIKRRLGNDPPMDLVYRSARLLSWRNPMLMPLILATAAVVATVVLVLKQAPL